MKYLVLFLIFFNIMHLAFSGDGIKKIKINKAFGIAVGDEKTSLEDVKRRAINEAKIDALKQAGIGENLSSYQNLYKTEDTKNYMELFTSDVLVNIRGDVNDVKELNVKKDITPEGFIQVTVEISCTVIKYTTDPDMTLDAEVDGIEKFYKSGDKLNFNVSPNVNSFARIFLVVRETNESFLIFPNEYHKNFEMKKGEKYSFPSDKYELELSTNIDSEIDNVIIVLLKEDIPYTGDISYEKIYRWINMIPLDKRKVITSSINITK